MKHEAASAFLEKLQPVILPLFRVNPPWLIQHRPVVEERIPAAAAMRLEQYRHQQAHRHDTLGNAVFPIGEQPCGEKGTPNTKVVDWYRENGRFSKPNMA